MGAYFANLHIRKNDAAEGSISVFLTEYFGGMGYTPADSDSADMTVSLYAPENSDWVSVCSDAFTHADILDLAPKLSENCGADVLSVACFDSDYLFLNLLNSEKDFDLWLNIGDTPEIKKPRRSNVAGWKGHVADHARFKTAAGKSYVCAEDFLLEAQEDLGIPAEQCAGYGLPEATAVLYFSAPVKAVVPPTKLTIPMYTLTPCEPGKRAACSVLNQGASSKGICILFTGDYVASEEITIDDAEFFYTDNRGQSVSIPIAFEKREWRENLWVYCWEDENFPIPPAVSDSLPPQVKMKKEFARSFGIRYVPKGNKRKFLDITVIFAPLSNFDQGQCGWRVWSRAGSKRDYIREHNQSEQDMRAYGLPEDMIAANLIDESDYDLD